VFFHFPFSNCVFVIVVIFLLCLYSVHFYFSFSYFILVNIYFISSKGYILLVLVLVNYNNPNLSNNITTLSIVDEHSLQKLHTFSSENDFFFLACFSALSFTHTRTPITYLILMIVYICTVAMRKCLPCFPFFQLNYSWHIAHSVKRTQMITDITGHSVPSAKVCT